MTAFGPFGGEDDDGGGAVYHVYPLHSEPPHVVDGDEGAGGSCWCGPRVMRPCQQCEGNGLYHGRDCWACEDGLAEVPGGVILPGMRVVVIHNDRAGGGPGPEDQDEERDG